MSNSDLPAADTEALRDYFAEQLGFRKCDDLDTDVIDFFELADTTSKPTPADALGGLMLLRLQRALDGRKIASLRPPPAMITVVFAATVAERQRLAEVLQDLEDAPKESLPEVHFEREAPRSTRDSNHFVGKVEGALMRGSGVIAIAARPESIPAAQEVLVFQSLTLASPDTTMLAVLLSVMHGDMSVRVEQSDSDIARLSHTQLLPVVAAPDVSTALDVLDDLISAMRPRAAITLDKVFGQAETVTALRQVITDMEDWRAGQLEWTEATRSFLLKGKPGTGKTLLAQALAGSAGVPFVKTSYSECQRSGHQGEMLAALYAKAEEAIRLAPSVFFIDEIDSFFVRESSQNGYIIGVVNGLLTLLDRLSATPGVILIAATNDAARVDPAVIRPGRFDRHLTVAPLDRDGVRAFLSHELQDALADTQLRNLVDKLQGTTGAELAAMLRDARTRARAARRPLSHVDIEAAVADGTPPFDEGRAWRISVHEAGHLLVSHLLDFRPASRAFVSNHSGWAEYGQMPLLTRSSSQKFLCEMLGGFVAESLVFDDPSAGSGGGANSDLARATELAIRAEMSLAFGETLSWHASTTPLDLLSNEIRERVEAVLQDARAKTANLIGQHEAGLLHIASVLLAERELDGTRIARVISDAMNCTPSSSSVQS